MECQEKDRAHNCTTTQAQREPDRNLISIPTVASLSLSHKRVYPDLRRREIKVPPSALATKAKSPTKTFQMRSPLPTLPALDSS